MKLTLSRMVVKFLKITGIALAAVLTLMFLLPYLFPGFVSAKIRQWARSSIRIGSVWPVSGRSVNACAHAYDGELSLFHDRCAV